MNVRVLDLLLGAGLLLSLGLLCDPILPWRHTGAIFVSPSGSDWRSGSSPDRPLATIQRAADLARPGDTVVILPGIYRERLFLSRGGRPGAPVVFRAARPGTVTITGEARPDVVRRLRWTDEGQGFFSAPTPWPVLLARGDGQMLFRAYDIDALKVYAARTPSFGAFFTDGRRLLVVFPDKRSPATHDLSIHSRVLLPGPWHTVRTSNAVVAADHIRFDGLIFDFGVGSGLHLWNAADVTVTDCLFTGAAAGIVANRGRKPADGLRVEHSLYHNYPQYEWARHWLSWAELYTSYSTSTLAAVQSDGAVIAGNLVVDCADGLELSTGDRLPGKGIDVRGNLIAECSDDALSLVGFSKRVRVHDNLVYDTHESVSLGPLFAGPVTVERNLFLQPFDGINGANVKLLGNSIARPVIHDVLVRDNVVVGNWLTWYDASIPLRNVSLTGNLFAVMRMVQPRWPAAVKDADNHYAILPQDGYPDPGQGFATIATLTGPGAAAGTSTAAALARGRGWRMSRPGPRWLRWESLPSTTRLAGRFSTGEFVR